MINYDLQKYGKYFSSRGELRLQRNQSSYLVLVNGDVHHNVTSSSQGFSVRSGKGGIFGFSSSAEINDENIKRAFKESEDKLNWLISKKSPEVIDAPEETVTGQWLFKAKNAALRTDQRLTFVQEIDNYITKKYPDLSMRNISLVYRDVEKKALTSNGSSFHLNRPHYTIYVDLTANEGSNPTSLGYIDSNFGFLEDNLMPLDFYYNEIDKLYEKLQKKVEGIYAKPGLHDVILDAELAGILSHEAIGHTTEADFVLKGSIAGDLMGKKVASDKVTLVDIAHTYNDKICPVPVYIDDEATLAKDAVIIKDGILQEFMHDKTSAARLGMTSRGNARGHYYYDEPLIRMRNTMIMPGDSNLEDMISSIDEGYYLVKSSNGQADSTSEFMFGVIEGYEIKKGKVGKAIKETTISGIAFDVLKSVSAVSNDYKFNVGTCGKKQSILVGMGGPAIRCKINIGGKA